MSGHASGGPTRASLGSYRLVRRLGAGGMAEVHEAVRPGASGFEKRVALKTLRPELEGDPALTRLLLEEARIGARLHHQNLVGVDELGVDGGVYFMVMELVDGADLASLAGAAVGGGGGRVSEGSAAFLCAEVALGLAALHRATDDAGRPLGLIHRDVSPHNVLVSRAGEVKLADYGIAKATLRTDITQQVRLKGKIAYMSPEQAASEPLDVATDVFSLGVTLVELVSGRRPYEGGNAVDTLERVKAAVPVELPGVTPGLVEVARKATARDKRDRYASATAFYEALVAVPGLLWPTPFEVGRWVAERLDARVGAPVEPAPTQLATAHPRPPETPKG